MKFCFVVASITGREHLLNKFIESVKKSKYRNADFYLYFQELDDAGSNGFDISFFKNVYISKSRDGVCLSRMYWLHKLDDYDFYIIVDDDMEFLGKEDFDAMMFFSQAVNDCGLVCADCRRTLKLYDKFVPKNKFSVKNVQWIYGGTVIKKSVRDLLVKEIDLKPYTYDGFCLITYINGYTNYMYEGCLTLHKAGAKHGFEYVRKNDNEFIPKFEKYIKKPIKEINGKIKLCIPFSENELTEEAKMLHKENRKN